MRRITIIAALSAVLLGTSLGVSVAGERGSSRAGCNSKSCELRVLKRQTFAKWRASARAYGLGLLRARMRCESGGDGGYRLVTIGGRYWFAHQFDVQAWTGAGGRMRGGRPVGVWTTQPTRAEQDARAVRWDAIHGGDPWPNCP